MQKIFFIIALVLMLSGCWTLKNYGAGECREYNPSCWSGEEICETDKRGCLICTCVERNGSFPQRYP